MFIGIINSAMFGKDSEPGEHVDWSLPDYFDADDFSSLVGSSVEDYAALSSHMIVWEADPEDFYPHPESCTCDDCMR